MAVVLLRGEVGGQLRREGWHEVVGRVDRAGGRVQKPRRGWISFLQLSPCPFWGFFYPRYALEETLSVDGCLPHERLKRTDCCPEPSQPVRTSPESASSAHAYCSAHPPWAVPGSSPKSSLSPPPRPQGHLCASAPLSQEAFVIYFIPLLHLEIFLFSR